MDKKSEMLQLTVKSDLGLLWAVENLLAAVIFFNCLIEP